MGAQRVNIDGVGRLPAFSHAVIAGQHLHVSGMLGADAELQLVEGGIRAETTRTLENLARIIAGCGGTFADVVKVNVHLTDMADFAAMNEAYLEFVGDDPPARITTGTTALALGAAVEMDCIAYREDGWSAPV
ncbi:RidA family protein [Pseudonocardia sp. CA-107938]|uniref:RidA family protein n=1 Tax=Pseudonocardia sp. CA-107938 TaxID=3240021 RepID=UPI003D8A4DF7